MRAGGSSWSRVRGEDMQLVRRAFEKKRGGYGAEMLLGAGY